MESYLTIVVRLVVIAFVAILVSLAVAPTADKIVGSLAGNNAVQPSDSYEPATKPVDTPMLMGIAIGAFIFAVATILLVYYRLQKFHRAVEVATQAGGNVTFTPDFSSKAFCWLHSKTILDLSGTKLSNEIISQISSLPRLEVLRFGSTNIIDSGADLISKCKHLRSLDISETKLGDHAMLQISKLRNLVTLIASKTQISNNSIDLLASLKKLRKLECSDTGITTEGLKRLDKLMPEAHIVGY